MIAHEDYLVDFIICPELYSWHIVQPHRETSAMIFVRKLKLGKSIIPSRTICDDEDQVSYSSIHTHNPIQHRHKGLSSKLHRAPPLGWS